MNNRLKWRHNVYLKLQDIDVRLNLEFIRTAIQHLPGVTEKLCYNTPAFYVNKKIFCTDERGLRNPGDSNS
jgi:hypothetical protein